MAHRRTQKQNPQMAVDFDKLAFHFNIFFSENRDVLLIIRCAHLGWKQGREPKFEILDFNKIARSNLQFWRKWAIFPGFLISDLARLGGELVEHLLCRAPIFDWNCKIEAFIFNFKILSKFYFKKGSIFWCGFSF